MKAMSLKKQIFGYGLEEMLNAKRQRWNKEIREKRLGYDKNINVNVNRKYDNIRKEINENLKEKISDAFVKRVK